jgi:hypothetical protein
MRCCASPTTSTVPDSRQHEAASQFAALLYQQTFAPLAESLGFYGGTAVAAAARSLARAERGGLVARLEQLFETARR